MAEKTSYLVTSVLLLVLLLLLHHPNFCHSAEEDSRCGCPGTNVTRTSVNEGSGAGIPFMKSSYSRWGGRNTLISGMSMKNLVVAAGTVVLYGGTVAVFAYLCLKSLNFSGLEMSVVASILNPSAMDDFDDSDHILSRRRVRSRQNNRPKAR